MDVDFSSTIFFAISFALAAAAGAWLRYVLSSVVQKIYGKPFPLGLFLVNVLGCLGFGAFMGLSQGMLNDIFMFSENFKTIIFTAFFGSFTTFSTYIFEADIFLKNKQYPALMLHIFGQITLGLLAFMAGNYIFVKF